MLKFIRANIKYFFYVKKNNKKQQKKTNFTLIFENMHKINQYQRNH